MNRAAIWLALGAALAACGNDSVPGPHFAEPRLRRLRAPQYVNSVRALLGDAAAAAVKPPADIATKGFESIGASELAPSDGALSSYEESAGAAAQVATGDLARLNQLMGCTPTGPEDRACFESFVRSFGRRAFRRPLTEDEVTRYATLAVTTATRNHNAYAGAGYTISAFLQSPSFLYQVEVGEVDPDDSSRRRLTGYEMATRMSMFLTDGPPDDDLLDAADRGLRTAADIRARATELVDRAEARGMLDNFYTERWKLRELGGLTKDPAIYPAYTAALGEAMREESLRLVHDVVWDRDADVRELLDAPYAFVNTDLAKLYGTQPVTGSGFEMRMLPDGRRGVLGQGAFLANQAHPGSTSPTRRGRFISERVLCIDIPPPPPDVNTTLPPTMPDMPMTMRQRLANHSSTEPCAGCHRRMDGVGLALENFDGIGTFRTTDEGLPIDPSGEIVGADGASIGTFQGLTGFTELVHDLPDVSRCWVRSLYRHGTGHIEVAGDEVALEQIDDSFAAGNYRLKSLLVDLVASDAFRFVDNVRGDQ